MVLAAIHADAPHRISTGKGIRVRRSSTRAPTSTILMSFGRHRQSCQFCARRRGSHSRPTGMALPVAGLIAARVDNAIGMFGVAPEPEIPAGQGVLVL